MRQYRYFSHHQSAWRYLVRICLVAKTSSERDNQFEHQRDCIRKRRRRNRKALHLPISPSYTCYHCENLHLQRFRKDIILHHWRSSTTWTTATRATPTHTLCSIVEIAETICERKNHITAKGIVPC